MAVRVAINGFGRTGRAVLRAAMKSPHDVEVVAVNDLGEPEALARLLARDSVHGHFPVPVSVEHDTMMVGSMAVTILMEPHPEELPWRELGIDVVIESTGRLTSRDKAAAHIACGGPAGDHLRPGQGRRRHLRHGRQRGLVRPGTRLRRLQRVVHHELPRRPGQGARRRLRHGAGVHDDGPRLHGRPAPCRRPAQGPAALPWCRDQHRADDDRRRPGDRPRAARRGRTARRAVAQGPGARRVDHRPGGRPSRATPTVGEICDAYRAAADVGRLAGLLEYSEDELVSTDIVGSPASCIFDSKLTMASGNLVKVLGWYDNETGYSSRLVDLATVVGGAVER